MKSHFWAFYLLKGICPAVFSDFSDEEYIYILQVSMHVCWIDILNIINAQQLQQISGIHHSVVFQKALLVMTVFRDSNCQRGPSRTSFPLSLSFIMSRFSSRDVGHYYMILVYWKPAYFNLPSARMTKRPQIPLWLQHRGQQSQAEQVCAPLWPAGLSCNLSTTCRNYWSGEGIFSLLA